MDINKIIPFILPSTNFISKLITEILLLEEKLTCPDEQSEYFLWGIESQIVRLSELKKDYEGVRAEYNKMTVDELLLACTEKQTFLREVVHGIHPIFARIIMNGSTQSTIRKLNDYFQMKSRVEKLPSLA